MHIVIVGPGALGCLFGATLLRGTADTTDTVTLLDYNKSRTEILNAQGLLYEKDGSATRFLIRTVCNPAQIDNADALLICVKSYDVDETLAFCAPLINNDTLLVFLQNGISHLKHRTHSQGTASVFATTTEGSTSLGPGHVRHAGEGTTSLGFLDPPGETQRLLLPRMVERLQAGGINAVCTETILTGIWTKLFINVGINALTVIHNCRNGELLEIPRAREQMHKAVSEAKVVAGFEDILIDAPLQKTEDVCRATARNISSMLQDVRKKRRTEIDAINGMIVLMARRHGIATPMNSYLIERIREIEARY
jgi:2-dehydropantoate 2-reductase